MLSGSVGSAAFAGGEDLTDEVKFVSDRADFTGTYSFIFKGACRGEEVAIKVLKLVSKKLNTTKRKFRRELAVWKHVNHPNISPLYGYTEGSGAFGPVGALISPWYDNGDAETFLEEKGDSLSIEERIDLWRGVVSGVCYLHEQDPKIVHGDLKPSNVLIDDRGSPRICDFGLACIYLEEGHTDLTTTSPHTGTERYLAPELLEDDAQPSTASDVWALGCIGLQFLYSTIPYQHRKSNRNGSIFQDIRQGVLPAALPTDSDSRLTGIRYILPRCWCFIPSSRISAPKALTLLHRIDNQRTSDGIEVNSTSIVYVASLAAAEIVMLANEQSAEFPVPRANPKLVKSIDEAMDRIVDKFPETQKRILGQDLLMTINRIGIKNAPRVATSLLDSEDLRSLAHLMKGYPTIFEEKVLQKAKEIELDLKK